MEIGEFGEEDFFLRFSSAGGFSSKCGQVFFFVFFLNLYWSLNMIIVDRDQTINKI